MLIFEDETTITQKPCIRKSMSLEGEQHKIEHTGSRNRFSAYISMLWPDQRLIYDFYDKMNSTNTIDHLEKLSQLTDQIVEGVTSDNYTLQNARFIDSSSLGFK